MKHTFTHRMDYRCAQCGADLEINQIGAVFPCGDENKSALCTKCTDKMLNDATIGQFFRIHHPMIYKDLLSVPAGGLL